ncbi:MAG: hypothetical protein WCH74_07785 [Chloroflexota bacterium]
MGRRILPTVAVVLVVAALMVGVLAVGVGSGPAAARPTPTVPLATGLPAGTYSSQRFSPGATFTLPAGWEIATDAPDYLLVRPAGSDVVGIHLFRDWLPASQDLACPSTAEPGVGTTSTEIVKWLRERPGLVVSDPRIVTVGGLRGTEVDVGIRDGWTASCPFAGGTPTVPFLVDSGSASQWVIAGGERLRLSLLDVPGGGTVIVDIDDFDGRLMDQLIADAVPIVASLAFATPAATPASTPGVSPAAAPSAAPVVSSAAPLALSETFTATNGRIIKLPAGWTTREDLGIVYLSTSPAASDRLVLSQTLSPGEIFVQFSENSIVGGASDPAIHLPDNLKLLLEGQGLKADPVVTFTSVGRPAAMIAASNDKLEMLAVSVKVRDDLFADVIAYMARGEKATYEPLILEMVDSLTYPGA